MAILNQGANLNLIPGISAQVVVHLSQGNVGDTITFYLFSGSEPFSGTGVAVALNGVRRDGVGFTAPCIIAGNVVTVTVTEGMTALEGYALAELVLTDGGGDSVGTANFALAIEEGTFPNGPTYDTDISVYQQILQYVQSYPALEQARIDAAVGAERTARVSEDAAIHADISALSESVTASVGNETTAREAADVALSEKIEAIQTAVGSPLVAAAVAEMTDVNRVYVYTGSETGYTAGNWYYWNGTAWVSGGVYNAVAVETDTTLTVSGKAADAKTVGERVTRLDNVTSGADLSGYADITGMYIDATGAEAANVNLKCSDYIRIPDDTESVTIYALYQHSTNLSPVGALYDANKTFIAAIGASGAVNGYKTHDIPGNAAKYLRFNASVKDADAAYLLCRFNVTGMNSIGYMGRTTFATTSGARYSVSKYMTVKQGHIYKIVAVTPSDAVRFRFMSDASSDGAVDMSPYDGSAVYIAPADGHLRGYNVSNAASLSVTVDVYDMGMIYPVKTRREYYVSKTGVFGAARAYTSLTQCLLDLKDDDTEKTIYIDGGDYDIYAEYVAAGVPVYIGDDPKSDYYDYCVWVPKNTHIIGRGIVRLRWDPSISTGVTAKQCQTVSPLNVAGSCTIENIEVYCGNGRYCLHNDGPRNPSCVGAVQRYINCRFYKSLAETVDGVTYGYQHTIGFGIDGEMRYEFDKCEFYNTGSGNAFYGHTRLYTGSFEVTEATSGNIVCRDCIIIADNTHSIRLDNYGETATDLHVRLLFSGCYIRGSLYIPYADYPNAFDIVLLNCNTITINKPNAKYPVSIYPPAE